MTGYPIWLTVAHMPVSYPTSSPIAMTYPIWHAVALALFATFFSFIFGYLQAFLLQRAQRKEKAIESVEKFCDELLDVVIKYWSTDTSQKNMGDMRILQQKINAYNMIIPLFIKDNFRRANNFNLIMKKINNEVTGGQFAEHTKKANQEIVAKAMGEILELRREIRKSGCGK